MEAGIRTQMLDMLGTSSSHKTLRATECSTLHAAAHLSLGSWLSSWLGNRLGSWLGSWLRNRLGSWLSSWLGGRLGSLRNCWLSSGFWCKLRKRLAYCERHGHRFHHRLGLRLLRLCTPEKVCSRAGQESYRGYQPGSCPSRNAPCCFSCNSLAGCSYEGRHKAN
jgi:hypothetical protein